MLDPFHDSPVRVYGLPDSDSSPTVVQQIRKSFSLTAPAGTSANWAAHVFTTPLLAPLSMNQASYESGAFKSRTWTGTAWADNQVGYTNAVQCSDGTDTMDIGTVNVHSWTTDVAEMFPSGQAFTKPASYQHQSPGIDQSTRARLIALGVEIVNTTPQLYIGGTATCYRLPTRVNESDALWIGHNRLLNNPSGGAGGDHTACITNGTVGKIISGPCTSVSDALFYPSTQQWNAKEGALVVATQDAARNPIAAGERRQIFIRTSNAPHAQAVNASVAPGTMLCDGYATYQQTVSATTSDVAGPFIPGFTGNNYSSALLSPFDTSGVFLTGLDSHSSFTITMSFIIEIAPDTHDQTFSNLVPLASPSCEEDKFALQLYQECARRLPPAVQSKYNPAGEWFAAIKRLIAKAAPIVRDVSGMLPIPGAGIVSRVAGAVANNLRSSGVEVKKAASKKTKVTKKKSVKR